jgi:cystathionine beta-lyase
MLDQDAFRGHHPEMALTTFDFESQVNRRKSSSHKWDFGKQLTGRDNLLPFWVADMDFQAAAPVLDALQKRLDHGVFGYTARPESLDEALIDWYSRYHQWDIDPKHILEAPGIVPFIHMIIRDFAEPGESVIIQEPVYYPFRLAIERNGRKVAVNRLLCDNDGRWTMDLDGLSDLIDESGSKLLIFCSPHNPVGRVWSESELLDLAELCRDKSVTVISDEIHADLVHSGHRHIPWLSLPENRLPQSMALLSATKSFNIPGLNTAYAIVPGENLRSRTEVMLSSLGIGNGSSSPLSYAASEAAWREGRDWLNALMVYLAGNDLLVREVLGNQLPEIGVAHLEGTYLEWLNFNRLGLGDDEIWERQLDAGVWLSRGSQFGEGGEGYLRMNIACPGLQLEEGLERLVKAFIS